MAARAAWKGTIQFGLVSIPVAVYKALGESPAEVGGFKDLCSCHTQPFSQTLVCPGGSAKQTDAAIKRGDSNLTPVVKGVPSGDDWVVIDTKQLDAINAEAKKLGESIPVEFVEAEEAPFHLSTGTYYLKVPKETKGAEPVLALFHTALAESGKVAVGRWTARTRQQPVLIYDYGDELRLNTLPFAAQQVAVPSVPSVPIPQATLEKAVKLIEQETVPFDWSNYEDDPVVEKYAEVVQAAVSGKPIPQAAPAAAQTPVDDLFARLEASLA